MPWKNSDTRYSTMSIALHWLMVVLLAVVYACIELRGQFPKGSGARSGPEQRDCCAAQREQAPSPQDCPDE